MTSCVQPVLPELWRVKPQQITFFDPGKYHYYFVYSNASKFENLMLFSNKMTTTKSPYGWKTSTCLPKFYQISVRGNKAQSGPIINHIIRRNWVIVLKNLPSSDSHVRELYFEMY